MATVYSLVCWGGKDGKTVTLSVASPCVATITNHGLRDGAGIVLSTTGALPTGLTAGTTYYARSTAANTFNLYDTEAHAVAGGTTGRINTSGTQSGTHTAKGAYWSGLSVGDKSRYGTAGSERSYDGLSAWNTGRAGASAFDVEVCEVGEAFTDYLTAQLNVSVPSAQNIIWSKVNGVRSEAWHGGDYPAAMLPTSKADGYVLNISTSMGGSSAILLNRYRDIIDGIIIKTTASTGVSNMISVGTTATVRNCFVIGFSTASPVGIQLFSALSSAINNVVVNCLTGIAGTTFTSGLAAINNTVAKCGTGIACGANIRGFWYNNISIGNTTNWSAGSAAYEGASKNAGLATDSPPVTGSGSSITIATTDFADYTNNNFRAAASSSPQVEAGVELFGAYAFDASDAVRPNYRPTPAGLYDVGAYEYDWGNGLAPETLLTINNLQSGSTVRIFASGTQTEQASTTSSGTSFAPTGLSGTVDYTIYKDGYIPIRVTGVALASGTNLPADGTQTIDRAYAASSGLTYGTTATINTSTLRFGVTTPTTGQNWYSFWVEQFRSNSALRNKPFPLQANGPNSFSLRLGYEFDGSASIANLSRDGVRYVDSGGTQTAVWAAILTVGVSSGMRVRYQQSDGGTTGSAAITSGNMDELVQVYGDGSHGAFDRRGYLVLKVQESGYDQVEADAVALYGALEDQLYVVGLAPTANGIATGSPGAVTATITDHGASPVIWHGAAYSITIQSDASGTTLMRWLRYNFEAGGTFQGLDAFNWHDLIQTNGSAFKTVRGAIYGDTGATLKGVRVITSTGADHPDFTLYTADDGSTYAPVIPATASATILADSRVQLYNVTTSTEIENVFKTGTSYSYTITTEASVGDTLRLRVCKKGRQGAEVFAVWAAGGVTFLVSQPEDTIYTAWGIDGATVTEFSLDGPNLQIDANDVDGATTKTRLGAFYSAALASSTSGVGIRDFYGALTFLSTAAIRVNVDIANLFIENTNATTALRFTDLDVRLYKSDGTSIIATTSYSIHNDYSGVPDVVETGVSGLTGAESAQLMGLPSATATATAVWAHTLP